MMNLRFRRGRSVVVWGLAASFLVLAAGPSAAAAGGSGEDICKGAFVRCALDNGLSLDGLNLILLFLNAQFCLAGYDFCKRYVAQFL